MRDPGQVRRRAARRRQRWCRGVCTGRLNRRDTVRPVVHARHPETGGEATVRDTAARLLKRGPGRRGQAGGDRPRHGGADLLRPRAARRRSRDRQDDSRACDRPVGRGCHIRAAAMHAGPAAHRHHGSLDLQPTLARVRVPRRAGVRQRGARRRGQPCDAAHAVGVARSDGRAPGDGRRVTRVLPRHSS